MHNSGLPIMAYHRSESDPIYYFAEDKWGHFDETWAAFYGGYNSESEAREALANYCKHYL